MKVYIAGSISGDKGYFAKFEAYEQRYKDKGHIVLNPARLPGGLKVSEYMRICFAMIEVADRVMFLPDWEQSGGARLEMEYCRYTGKPFQIIKNPEK